MLQGLTADNLMNILLIKDEPSHPPASQLQLLRHSLPDLCISITHTETHSDVMHVDL